MSVKEIRAKAKELDLDVNQVKVLIMLKKKKYKIEKVRSSDIVRGLDAGISKRAGAVFDPSKSVVELIAPKLVLTFILSAILASAVEPSIPTQEPDKPEAEEDEDEYEIIEVSPEEAAKLTKKNKDPK